MRIVGGMYRGRKLIQVGKKSTRETADMVKESVFNMLGGTTEGIILDLFAGSGAYGLEAISRGAKHLFAVDHDKDAIRTILANAEMLGEKAHITVIHQDYLRFLHALDAHDLYDYIFIDPPYEMMVHETVIASLKDHLNPDGIMIFETKKQVELPTEIGDLHQIKTRTYGIKRITLYQKTDISKH